MNLILVIGDVSIPETLDGCLKKEFLYLLQSRPQRSDTGK
jgi:hypothetical protein